MRKIFAALILSVLLATSASALDVPPHPFKYVSDLADIYSDEFESELNNLIGGIESETTAEIGVLTIPSLEDEALEDFATEVFREWGIGQKESDNGLLLLISVADRSVRIEVGYGLEGRITDANADYIIDNRIIPAFKEEQFEKGTRDAITDMKALILEEFEAEGFKTQNITYTSQGIFHQILIAFFIALAVMFVWFFVLIIPSQKTGEKLQKMPGPHVGMLGALLFMMAPMITWIAGLIMAHGVFELLKRISLDKSAKGGGGSTRSTYKPPRTRSSGSAGRTGSGGQRFGGGSSGGGGASGKW